MDMIKIEVKKRILVRFRPDLAQYLVDYEDDQICDWVIPADHLPLVQKEILQDSEAPPAVVSSETLGDPEE